MDSKAFSWDGMGGDNDDDTFVFLLATFIGTVALFLILVVTVAIVCMVKVSRQNKSEQEADSANEYYSDTEAEVTIRINNEDFSVDFSDSMYSADDSSVYSSSVLTV